MNINWNTLLPSVEELVESFTRHWSEELENKGSAALRATWAQLFTAFREQIIDYDDPKKRAIWPIIGAATGAGKTQAMIFFFARLAALPPELHPGARLVTRRKVDANIIAKQINRYAIKYGWLVGERAEISWTAPDDDIESMPEAGSYATSWHTDNGSKKGRKVSELGDSCVVTICHNGLTAGMERDPAALLYMYNDLPRRSLVIDEALDLCRAANVTAWDVEKVATFTPPEIRMKFPSTMAWLRRMTERAGKVGGEGRIFRKALPLIGGAPPNLLGLLKAVKAFTLTNKRGMRKGEFITFENSIKALGLFVTNWAWYVPRENSDVSISTAQNVAGRAARGAIILDATARQQKLYSYLKNAVKLPVVEGTRNYGSVLMHAFFGYRTGGDFMSKNAAQLAKEYIIDLDQQVALNEDGTQKRALLVTHMGPVEDSLNEHHDLAKNFTFEVAHFHSVEGSNKWKDCEIVGLLGLPHRNPEWPKTTQMGMKGVEREKWAPGDEDRVEIASIEIGQMSSDVIQCLNRGRCRKVTTDDGGCPSMDIYLLLPGDKDKESTMDVEKKGHRIVEAIEKEMPRINMVEWEYGPGKTKKVAKTPKPKPKKTEEIMEYLLGMEMDTWRFRKEIQLKHDMPDRSAARLTVKFRDDDPEVLHLKEAGVYAAEIIDETGQRRAILGRGKMPEGAIHLGA